MMDLKDLYQEIIVDHNRDPRNFYEMTSPTRDANGFNPLCGDKLHLFLKMDGECIEEASFVGKGCAISTASASLMTEAIRGKTVEEAMALFERFHQMVTTDAPIDTTQIDRLSALAGVRTFPSRVKCATLAWHTLAAILNDNATVTVSTE